MKLLLSMTRFIISLPIVPSLYGRMDQPEQPVCGRAQAMACKTALAGFILAFAFTLNISAQNEHVPQNGRPSCGTVSPARAGLPLTVQQYAPTAPSSELLLYLRFEETTMRAGFESATNHTSEIISGTRTCPRPNLTGAEIAEIVRLVSDDFSPFNIRVTTDENEFNAFPPANREVCQITTDPSVLGFPIGIGGVSPWRGMGNRFRNATAFVFAGPYRHDTAEIALVVSHESGHLLGLGHQSLFGDACSVVTEYHPGFGTGPLAFDMLMGGDFVNRPSGITNWFAQSCPNPDIFLNPTDWFPQNDFELINNQVDVRVDDFPDAPSGGRPIEGVVNGILERGGDVDYIPVVLRGPGVISVSSDNIDLKVSIVSPNGLVMEEYNDTQATGVSFPSGAGFKLLKIEAVSNTNMDSRFMTGTYKVTH